MFARVLSFFTSIAPDPPRKTESVAYKMGLEAAQRNWADDTNPFPAGSQEHADWADGQLAELAARQW